LNLNLFLKICVYTTSFEAGIYRRKINKKIEEKKDYKKNKQNKND